MSLCSARFDNVTPPSNPPKYNLDGTTFDGLFKLFASDRSLCNGSLPLDQIHRLHAASTMPGTTVENIISEYRLLAKSTIKVQSIMLLISKKHVILTSIVLSQYTHRRHNDKRFPQVFSTVNFILIFIQIRCQLESRNVSPSTDTLHRYSPY